MRKSHTMKRKVAPIGLAAAFMTAFATAAFAQLPMPSISLGDDTRKLTPEELEKQKAIDNAYRSANQKIPEKKSAADPWGDVRPAPSTDKPASATKPAKTTSKSASKTKPAASNNKQSASSDKQ
jgi:hypothetical protein